jgi:hypothetical protein
LILAFLGASTGGSGVSVTDINVGRDEAGSTVGKGLRSDDALPSRKVRALDKATETVTCRDPQCFRAFGRIDPSSYSFVSP